MCLTDEEDGEGVDLSVVVGVTSGVLLVLFILTIVLFIITRYFIYFTDDESKCSRRLSIKMADMRSGWSR